MTTQIRWNPLVELNSQEQRIAKVLAKGRKFYLFLREVRHELFDEEFQNELAMAYQPRGTEPLPPALLATVTLLQAYDKTGDHDAVTKAQLDLSWQLVLDCLGEEKAPFSQGVLSQFRERMIEHDLDKKLLDRTVELAKRTGKFGWQHLKAALDSSPLLGAGRVLDTWNLIGRALSTVVTCAAKATGVDRTEIIAETKLSLSTSPSLKTALDIDWDDDDQRSGAMQRLLGEVDRVEAWVAQHGVDLASKPALQEAIGALRRVLDQDLEPDPSGGGRRIKRGVAKDRMPSLGDREMRHGRKSKNRLFNGYKRHLLKIVDAGLTVAAEVFAANQPEQEAMAPLIDHAEHHGQIEEILIDRGYLGSPRIAELRSRGATVRCKPWRSHNAGRFTKEQFDIQLPKNRVVCPAGHSAKITGSHLARFADRTCASCSLRDSCTSAKHKGRTISIHPEEALLIQLRGDLKTQAGRTALRERTTIEHSLARLARIQGPRARYKGVRKNALDVRRCAAVDNLQTLARMRAAA